MHEKKVDDPSPRVEVLYPRAGMNPVSMDVATAACYQDLVDIFCKDMWIRPDKQTIEYALKVAFKNRQSRYGKTIVPDRSLTDLLAKAKALPKDWDSSVDESFVRIINSKGWRLIENLMVEHEVLIIAMMSISCFNWCTIKNRHTWDGFRDRNQNRCAGQLL
jgi:hypothetical protein